MEIPTEGDTGAILVSGPLYDQKIMSTQPPEDQLLEHV